MADHYPLSYAIPDFYHALEHLYPFADKSFVHDTSDRTLWCDKQKELLPVSGVGTVLASITLTSAREEGKKNLIHYCENSKKRMRYKPYRNMGYGIIGSGAIESARRTVIQKKNETAGVEGALKT